MTRRLHADSATRLAPIARIRRRLRQSLATVVLSFAILPAGSYPASSNEELALALLDLVQTIEASPGWSARMRGLSVDETTGTATIDTLIVAAQSGGLGLRIEGATLNGFKADDRGGFAVAALDIASAAIATAGTEIVLTDFRLDDIETPGLPAFSFNRIKPLTSLVAVLDAVAKSRISGGRVAEITVGQIFEGDESVISYRNVELGPLADGTLAVASAGPLALRSPADDPLAQMTVARAEAHAIDLDSFLQLLDPLRYVAGVGDGIWRQAIDSIKYSDFTFLMPSIRMTVESIISEDVQVRQPPESFAPFIDGHMSQFRRPRIQMESLRARHLANLLSAFGTGRLAVRGIEIDASGIDQLTLARLELTDVADDRLGGIAVEEFVAAIAGQGAVVAGRFALGDVILPSFDTIQTALESARRDADVDFSSLAPKLGFVEMADINVRAINFPGVALGRLRADFDKHIGKVPTNILVDLDNLDIAADSLPGQVKGLIAGLGYERIVVDAGFGINWRETEETVAVDDFHLDIADFGNTTASLVLAGLTREALEKSDERAILGGLLFKQARLTFDDNSVVDRSLSMRAEVLNVPLDRLKQQLAGALPLMLAVVGDAELVKEIVPVLQDFIKTPGILTIDAAPAAPVPVAAIGTAIRTRPQSLPGLLSISVSGSADPAPEPQDSSGTPAREGPASKPTEGAGDPVPDPPAEKPVREVTGQMSQPEGVEQGLEPEGAGGRGGATEPIPEERPERADREVERR